MSFVNATFLSSETVVLYCQSCNAQVDTIHSNEILPLMMYLSSHNEEVLCMDCSGYDDLIPNQLIPYEGESLIIGNVAVEFNGNYQVTELVRVPACLVNHNSKK